MFFIGKIHFQKYFLSLILFCSIPFISIGDSVDLNKAIEDLEYIEENTGDDCNDKKRLNQLIHLFKDEIKDEEKNDIYNIYDALEYSCPQSKAYKTVLNRVIIEYNISCKTLGEEKNDNLKLTYDEQIENLINVYKYIEEKAPDKYGKNHKKNVEIFEEIQRIFNECEVDTSRIDFLKNDIAAAGFGNLTYDFKNDLEDLIARLKTGELGVNIRSCKTLGEELDYYYTPFDERLNYLIKQYFLLKKQGKFFGSDHENNLKIFYRLQRVFKDCLVDIDIEMVENLQSSIITSGFGHLTNSFKNDLEDLIVQLKDRKKNEFINTEIKDSEISQDHSNGRSIFLTISLVIISFLIAPALFYLLSKTEKNFVKKQFFSNKIDSDKRNLTNQIGILNSKIKLLSKRTKNRFFNKKTMNYKLIEQDIDYLRKQIVILKGKVVNLETIIEYERNKKNLGAQLSKDEEQADLEINNFQNIYYFPAPTLQGYFNSIFASVSPKIGSSIYKFYINDEQDEAEFEFYFQTSTFNKVIENPFETLFSVCDVDGDFYNTKGIITLEKGKLIKDANVWVVKKKAHVKFIK